MNKEVLLLNIMTALMLCGCNNDINAEKDLEVLFKLVKNYEVDEVNITDIFKQWRKVQKIRISLDEVYTYFSGFHVFAYMEV